MQSGRRRPDGAAFPQPPSRTTIGGSGSNLWRQPASHDIRTVWGEVETVFSHFDAIDNEIGEPALGTGEAVQIH
jgi:hypothetical protein